MNIKYLRYLLRHKWYVFRSCLLLKVPLWRAIIHDWSKFLPSEWRPYTHFFYGDHPRRDQIPFRFSYYTPDSDTKEYWADRFDRAWNKHQKRQPHHWQHWVMIMDSGETKILEMPEVFIREMVADWMGAGLAITGKMETPSWYLKNRDKMKMGHATRKRVEEILGNGNIFNPDLYTVRYENATRDTVQS